MSTIPKQKFWMVYGMDQGAPAARHKSLKEAQAEAREFDVVTLREPVETYPGGLRQPSAHEESNDGIPF